MQPKPITAVVTEVIRETKNTHTFTLQPSQNIDYLAGQFITLIVMVKGIEYRRSYSLSSAPHENQVRITVKRLNGGIVSNYLADHVFVDHQLTVLPAEGRFSFIPEWSSKRQHYFFAAGSGITPIFSIIKSVLTQEPKSTVFLLFGNRTKQDIIFDGMLNSLINQYPDRLKVQHTLSSKVKGGIRLFVKNIVQSITQPKYTGRISAKNINNFFLDYPNQNSRAQYYICGPDNMINDTRSHLLGLNIDAKQIHIESFGDQLHLRNTKGIPQQGHQVKVHLQGQNYEVKVPTDSIILDLLLKERINAPYSCASGACSTCMAKVTKGQVHMRVCYALDEEEIAEGYILTCQSQPISSEVEIDYDI